ncbi:helix-turn-helix transcriptional regulator [Agathobaculum hominis]
MANPLLQQYIKVTEFLGLTLGPDYEVALHDMTDKNRSIIAIANNHISGRDVGAPLTNVALKTLMDRSYETQDYRLHYCGMSAKGKVLRSSTMFIKQNGKLIGMLCINFDDSKYREASDAILKLCHPDRFVEAHVQIDESQFSDKPACPPAVSPESFHNSIGDVAEDAVANELSRLGVSADRLTPEERLKIVASLKEGGIFLLKGAVKDVAAALSCSQASIYRHLAQLKSEVPEE